MKKFLYEIHCHTKEVSRCSKISARELVRFYHRINVDGVFITDHFFNNPSNKVPNDISWEERVDGFCEGYNIAYEEGKKLGIKVFFAFEYTYCGTDFLIYGIDRDWLIKNEDCLLLKPAEFMTLVRKNGAFVTHAHPFREWSDVDMIRLMPRNVDGAEVYNDCRTPFENKLANQFAENYSLIRTAGTDNHTGERKRAALMQFDCEINSSEDFVSALKEGRGVPVLMDCETGKITEL